MTIQKLMPVSVEIANQKHCQADMCPHYKAVKWHGYCDLFETDLSFDADTSFEPGAGVLRCVKCIEEFGSGEE